MLIKHAGKVISVDADKCASIEIPATTGAEIISLAKNVTNLGYFGMFGFDKPSVGVPAATIHYGRMSMCFASEVTPDVDSGQDIHTVRLARALEGYGLTQGQILHVLERLWPQLGLKKKLNFILIRKSDVFMVSTQGRWRSSLQLPILQIRHMSYFMRIIHRISNSFLVIAKPPPDIVE